jgi:hypothetical protein
VTTEVLLPLPAFTPLSLQAVVIVPEAVSVGRFWVITEDWCHLHTTERVRRKKGEPIPEQWIVRCNSGMARVIPAWKIRELLEMDELVELRRIEDEAITKRMKESPVELD